MKTINKNFETKLREILKRNIKIKNTYNRFSAFPDHYIAGIEVSIRELSIYIKELLKEQREGEETTTFEKAKVGDRVYELQFDCYGNIIEIDNELELQLKVELLNTKGEPERIEYYDYKGNNEFRFRSLYWDKPDIIAPVKLIKG